MNKTVELKPCPFCGGKAILNASHSVECINACICPVIPRTWTYDTDEEAIEAWNHRIPIVDAISKDQYEERLKADMEAILTDIKLKLEEKSFYYIRIFGKPEDEKRVYMVELDDVNDIIQEKINALKEQINEQ